jgi:hypothetical protein
MEEKNKGSFVHLVFKNSGTPSLVTYNQVLQIPLNTQASRPRDLYLIDAWMTNIPNILTTNSPQTGIALNWNYTPSIEIKNPFDETVFTNTTYYILPFRSVAQLNNGAHDYRRIIFPGTPALKFWLTYDDSTPLILNSNGTDLIWQMHVTLFCD